MGGVFLALRGCLMAPFPIHVAPRFDGPGISLFS